MTENNRFILQPLSTIRSGKLISGCPKLLSLDVQLATKRLMGYDVLFDGSRWARSKIQQKAEEAGVTPQAYVDGMAVGVKGTLEIKLDISYDKFIRTTDDYYEKVVADVFERLLAQDDIYLGEYSGWYSVIRWRILYRKPAGRGLPWWKMKVTGGIAPSGQWSGVVSEESYFLRLSKYQELW